MWLGRSVLCATLAVILLGLVLASDSDAHDSLAPPGAAHNWLPHYDWVYLHWVPFDEADLDRKLGIDTRGLYAWLRNDHRTLAQLARRKGLDPKELVEELIAPCPSTRGTSSALMRRRSSYSASAGSHRSRSRAGAIVRRTTCARTCSASCAARPGSGSPAA